MNKSVVSFLPGSSPQGVLSLLTKHTMKELLCESCSSIVSSEDEFLSDIENDSIKKRLI